MATLLLPAATLAIWCIYNAYCFILNYHRAPQLNIPLVCVPISPDNPLWIALQTSFSSVFKHVPFDYFSVTRYCQLGWEFHDRYKTHQRLGDAWILVTPDKNWFYTSHAEAACEIFSRSREFGRPVWMIGRIIDYSTSQPSYGSLWSRCSQGLWAQCSHGKHHLIPLRNHVLISACRPKDLIGSGNVDLQRLLSMNKRAASCGKSRCIKHLIWSIHGF